MHFKHLKSNIDILQIPMGKFKTNSVFSFCYNFYIAFTIFKHYSKVLVEVFSASIFNATQNLEIYAFMLLQHIYFFFILNQTLDIILY